MTVKVLWAFLSLDIMLLVALPVAIIVNGVCGIREKLRARLL